MDIYGSIRQKDKIKIHLNILDMEQTDLSILTAHL